MKIRPVPSAAGLARSPTPTYSFLTLVMLTPVKLLSGNFTSVHAPVVTAVSFAAVAFLPALSSTVA